METTNYLALILNSVFALMFIVYSMAIAYNAARGQDPIGFVVWCLFAIYALGLLSLNLTTNWQDQIQAVMVFSAISLMLGDKIKDFLISKLEARKLSNG